MWARLRGATTTRASTHGGGVTRASSAIDLAPFDLFQGYDYNALIRATSDGQNAYDPRYGMDDLFEAGTQGQFSVKFLF